MASIRPGTLGSFKSATAEGRALEVLIFVQLQESDPSKNPDGKNAVTASIDLEDGFFRGTYTLAAEQTINTSGYLTIAATPYLSGVSVSPGGDDPTFKSTVVERYLLESLMYLQGLERSTPNNPQGRNYIAGSFNSDTGLYQGSFQLPISYALTDDGKFLIQALPYLTD